jgi:hypothetical protein
VCVGEQAFAKAADGSGDIPYWYDGVQSVYIEPLKYLLVEFALPESPTSAARYVEEHQQVLTCPRSPR